MLHADLHHGWRSALRSLAANVSKHAANDETPLDDEVLDVSDDTELEPFHLDDTELAGRLVRDRGLIHYSTPPHTHLLFPQAVQS
jgi:hypothetical protein